MAQKTVGVELANLGIVKGIGDSNNEPNKVIKDALTYLYDGMKGTADAYIFNANSADTSIATGNGLVQLPDGIAKIVKKGQSYFVVEGASRGIMVVGSNVLKFPDDTRYNNGIETLAGYIGEVNTSKIESQPQSTNARRKSKLNSSKTAYAAKKSSGVTSINNYAIAN